MIVTADALFPGIEAGSAKKVNGPTLAPEADEFAEVQGPVSDTIEYWTLVMTALVSPRLLKMTEWFTPSACWPVMTPEKLTVFGAIFKRGT